MARSRRSVLPVVVAGAAALALVSPAFAGPASAGPASADPASSLAASPTTGPYDYTVGRPVALPAGALVDLDPTVPRAYVVTQTDASPPDGSAIVNRVDVAGVDPVTRRVLTRSRFTDGSNLAVTAVDTVHHRLLLGSSLAGVAEVDGLTGQLRSPDVSGDDGHVDSLVTDPGTGSGYATTERAGAASVLRLGGGAFVTRPDDEGFTSLAPDGLRGRLLVEGREGLESFDTRTLTRLDARQAQHRLFAAGVDPRTGAAFALDDRRVVRLDTSTGLETGALTLDEPASGDRHALVLDPGTSTLYVARAHDVLVVDEATLRPVATIPVTGDLLVDPVHHVLYVHTGDVITPVTQRPVVPPATGPSVRVLAGGDQSQDGGLVFAVPPRVAVTGTDGRPLSGATVRFTAPTGRASFRTTAGPTTTATVTTAADGSATAPALVAGPTVGRLEVGATATVAGVTVSTHLSETVEPSPVASLDTLAPRDEVQSALTGTRFARPVTVTARDLAGRTAAGRPVRFTLTGPATFVGGGPTALTSTGPGGTATSPAVVAGSGPGPVTVLAVAEQPSAGIDASPHAVVPLSVTGPGPAAADLRVAVTGVPAVTDVTGVGTRFDVVVTVTNVGTAAVTDGIVVLSTTNRVSIDWPEPGTFDQDGLPQDRGSEQQLAHVAVVALPDGLAPGQTATVGATLVAARPGGTHVVARVAAGAADRRLADNTASAAITIS